MIRSRFQLAGMMMMSLLLVCGTAVFAGGDKVVTAKKSAPAKGDARPQGKPSASRHKASGLPKAASLAPYDVDVASLISKQVNALGQTVIVVKEVKHDVSEPLSVLANMKPAPMSEPSREIREALERESEEREAHEGVVPPKFRHYSAVPDPVVQTEIPQSVGGIIPMAPSTGFNFAAQANSCGGCQPPDTNGTVGYDPATGTSYYVQMVNTRYQVWSLNYGTSVATSVLASTANNALWTTFGGACAAQNSGDPVALYDKLANRWFLTQFTSNVSGGFFYQCVAVSTSGNPLGTYNRYAFPVPTDPNPPGNNLFGDYPHWGVWPDGYYLNAHLFDDIANPTDPPFIAGDFGVANRAAMLTGAAATMQHILDATEYGFMPADLDGFAPPPTGAPGIFLALHAPAMTVYRFHVDWAVPANTTKTIQAKAPYAPYSDACVSAATYGQCVPQPGTAALLATLTGHVMFRGAYRNAIDHESMWVTHSVDPSIAGVEAGVRWYEVRISGPPDATCTAFPCIYQQGTIANLGNDSRDRWMASMASDTAGNALVGYSVQGLTNLSDNHSIRYTGRQANDPLGTMTAPEANVQIGTRNNAGGRWGDYSSMSIDPIDDCTFWFTTEYYTGVNWATKVNSARYPAGSGAGQCPATTCTARPASVPTIGTASVPGLNQITVTWTGIAPTPGSYALERSEGTCASPTGYYQPLAFVAGGTTTFTDTTVQGGHTYAYRVVAATDTAGKCQGLAFSGCVNATATGNCILKPTFTGASSGSSNNNATCGVNVNWTTGVSNCPLTPTVRYNIFRGTAPDFVPALANRIASCAPGPSSYLDTASLTPGVTYYYVARAEDNSTVNGGECGGGNEETNSVVVPGTAYGPGLQAGTGTWTDGAGDTTAFMQQNVQGGGNSPELSWRFLKTTTDAGAAHTGVFGYRDAGPLTTSLYLPDVCAEMDTPPLTVGAASVALSYWERHNLEWQWDGAAVEYSRNGGAWTAMPAPAPATDWGALAQTTSPPVNACGYLDTYSSMYTGPNPNPAAATAYAQRTHTVSGLVNNDTIKFRFRHSSDPALEFNGFYVDDIAVTNIHLPNTCVTGGGCSAPSGFSAPTAVDANACTATGITVTWTAPGAWGGTAGTYIVLRDAVAVASGACSGTLPNTTLSCLDTPGDALAHTYTIRATNGCASSTTSAASGSATDGADVTPPGNPAHTIAKATPNMNFSWAAVPTTTNYTNYRTTTPAVPASWASQNVTATLAWTNAADLGTGTSYFYSTTAMDACLNESPK